MTTTTAPARAGDVVLQVQSTIGFCVGMGIEVGAGERRSRAGVAGILATQTRAPET